MQHVPNCQICGEKQRTVVCEYNRLIFHESLWTTDLARYDYALCHGCGIVYSTRRPDPEEYRFLYDNFDELLIRSTKPERRLSEAIIQQIDDKFLNWWELGFQPPGEAGGFAERLRADFARSMEYLVHIVSAVNVEGGSVLSIRAKSSTLLDVLRRVFGAKTTHAMTLFERDRYMCQKNEGVTAISELNFDEFRIPFEQKYDLIIENHLLVHAIKPSNIFSEITSHLSEGGVIFLRNELDDTRLFKSKNLFAELRPFHFNQFDIPTLERMLRCFGFEPINISHRSPAKPEVMGAAKLNGAVAKKVQRISAAHLNARLQMYSQWRDESILSLPKERCHALFGGELRNVWKRVGKRLNGEFKPRKLLRNFAEARVPNEELELYAQSARPRGLKPIRSVFKLLNRQGSPA